LIFFSKFYCLFLSLQNMQHIRLMFSFFKLTVLGRGEEKKL
jgi:hypothetical protein